MHLSARIRDEGNGIAGNRAYQIGEPELARLSVFQTCSFVYNSWHANVNSVGPPTRLPQSLNWPLRGEAVQRLLMMLRGGRAEVLGLFSYGEAEEATTTTKAGDGEP